MQSRYRGYNNGEEVKITRVKAYDFLEKPGDFFIAGYAENNKPTLVIACPFCTIKCRAEHHEIPSSMISPGSRRASEIPLTLKVAVICGSKACGQQYSIVNGEAFADDPAVEKV